MSAAPGGTAADLRTLLTTPDGFQSREVARFMWMLDEQRRGLIADTRGLSAADLEWQPAPGTNTIGMLLAHIAYAETHLGQVGLLGETTGHPRDVIGIGEEDEGMPLPPDGAPPAALAGKELAWFDDVLGRARAHTARAARDLEDDVLDVEILRPPRPDGSRRVFNKSWVLYHLIEHEAGHRAQINLIKHLRRASAPSR